MDFDQVLHTAQKNEKSNKNGVRYYSTKFEPPKKITKSAPELSANIKKFLAKKEAEEKKKAEEDKKRREELLALRSQDKKATRRVNVMLKRTKSANQSVIEDAVDKDNTAVTLAGPMQPDEDDYGYVSQEASAFYNQMMEKYSKMPDEPKFDMTKKKVSTNLSSTKDRVRAALEKEKEEAMLPHRRKRKHKDKKEDEDEEGISYEAPERGSEKEKDDRAAMPPPKPKPKPKMAPPPLNFAELLKIAEKKQHEPIIIEKKKEKEDEPLFTKRQRREMEREREAQQRREDRRREMENGRVQRVGGKSKPPSLSDKQSTKAKPNVQDRIPKVGDPRSSSSKSSSDRQQSNSDSGKGSSSQKSSDPNDRGRGQKTGSLGKSKRPLSPEVEDRPNRKYLPGDLRYKPEMEPKKFPPEDHQPRKTPSDGQPTKMFKSNDGSRKLPPNDLSSRKPQSTVQSANNQGPPRKPQTSNELHRKASSSTQQPARMSNGDVIKKKYPSGEPQSSGRKYPSSDGQSKRPLNGQAPSRNVTSGSTAVQRYPPGGASSRTLPPKQFPPADLRPKQFPPADVRRKGDTSKKKPVANKRRIIDDDDDEYDSEMDDFIDDDDDPDNDYSRQISEIFGYDKSRYRDVDDDVDNMESSFAQVMREDVISTKIGIMEDLEDMKKEEEEKKRKMLMKKRRF